MKIDGKMIAQAMLRKKKNDEYKDEGKEVIDEVEHDPLSQHIDHFIEAMHKKDPKEVRNRLKGIMDCYAKPAESK
jgi:hypothetical protein